MKPRERFETAELLDGDEPNPSDTELAAALAMARDLESGLGGDLRTTAAFSDRVMAAIRREPAPTVAGLFGRRQMPLVGRFLASVRDAWVLTVNGGGRPLGLRAGALAYVLLVAVAATAIGGAAVAGAAGALGVFNGDRTTPSPTELGPTPEPSETSSTPLPAPESNEPPSAAEPSETDAPGASDGPQESGEANETGDPSASPSPDDSSGQDDVETPNPSSSPATSDTPEPSGTSGHG